MTLVNLTVVVTRLHAVAVGPAWGLFILNQGQPWTGVLLTVMSLFVTILTIATCLAVDNSVTAVARRCKVVAQLVDGQRRPTPDFVADECLFGSLPLFPLSVLTLCIAILHVFLVFALVVVFILVVASVNTARQASTVRPTYLDVVKHLNS